MHMLMSYMLLSYMLISVISHAFEYMDII